MATRGRGLELRVISLLLLLFLIPSLGFIVIFANLYDQQQGTALDRYLTLGRRTIYSALETAQLNLQAAGRHLQRIYQFPESFADARQWLDDHLPESLSGGTVLGRVFPEISDPGRGNAPFSTGLELITLEQSLGLENYAVVHYHGQLFGIHRFVPGDARFRILLYQKIEFDIWESLRTSFGLNFAVFKSFPQQILVSNLPPQFATQLLDDPPLAESVRFSLPLALDPDVEVLVSLPLTSIEVRSELYLQIFLVYVLALAVSVFGAIWILRVNVLNRIQGLVEQAGRLQSDLKAGKVPEPLFIPGKDELSGFAHTLSEFGRELAGYTRELNFRVDSQTQQLSRAARAAQSFYTRMSHEIRAPLQSIIGYVELLESKVSDPAAQHYISTILSEAGRLEEITNQALILGRLESGVQQLAKQSFDLAEFLTRLETRVSADFPQVVSRLRLKLGKEVPDRVVGDENLLVWIWSLCIGEIYQQNPHGNLVFRVQLQDFQDSRVSLRFSLEYEGRELFKGEESPTQVLTASKILGVLDSEFEYVSRPRDEDAELHRLEATIWFDVGRASPLAAPDAAAKLADDGRRLQGRTVLLGVPPGPSRDYLTEILTEWGVRTISADSGSGTVRLAQELHPSMILLQLHFPDLSGIDAAASISSALSTRDIPIIGIMDDWSPKALEHPEYFVRVLRTPVRRSELISALHAANSGQSESPTISAQGPEKAIWDAALARQVPGKMAETPKEAIARIRRSIDVTTAATPEAGQGFPSRLPSACAEIAEICAEQGFLRLEQRVLLLQAWIGVGSDPAELPRLSQELRRECDRLEELVAQRRTET